MVTVVGTQPSVCRACHRALDPLEPRYKVQRLERGGKQQGSGRLVAHLCQRCGKGSEKGWDLASEHAANQPGTS